MTCQLKLNFLENAGHLKSDRPNRNMEAPAIDRYLPHLIWKSTSWKQSLEIISREKKMN
jgi:hypothetical protein